MNFNINVLKSFLQNSIDSLKWILTDMEINIKSLS